jgi:hypothetical protein
MRLRPLTEAECYARCYGGRRPTERVSVAPVASSPARTEPGEEHLRELFEERLEARPLDEEAA